MITPNEQRSGHEAAVLDGMSRGVDDRLAQLGCDHAPTCLTRFLILLGWLSRHQPTQSAHLR